MKYIVFILGIIVLSACGDEATDDVNNIDSPSNSADGFTLHNVRFDAKDYYEGESVPIIAGEDFAIQWVLPSSEPYRIDLYLTTRERLYTDNDKVAGLKCGNTSFSLCPNATGEVTCNIDDNLIACAIKNDPIGSDHFQYKNSPNLKFIIRACDFVGRCDVKTFNLLVQPSSAAAA